MPNFVTQVRLKCPVGVSHTHSHSINNGKEKNNKQSCFLCNPRGDSVAINFSRNCPNTIKIKKYILTLDQKLAIYFGFQNLYKKYGIFIPPEIFMIINNILERGFNEQTPLKIDTNSINHMMGCKLCSKIFMDMIDEHACNKHVLPRKQAIHHFQ